MNFSEWCRRYKHFQYPQFRDTPPRSLPNPDVTSDGTTEVEPELPELAEVITTTTPLHINPQPVEYTALPRPQPQIVTYTSNTIPYYSMSDYIERAEVTASNVVYGSYPRNFMWGIGDDGYLKPVSYDLQHEREMRRKEEAEELEPDFDETKGDF